LAYRKFDICCKLGIFLVGILLLAGCASHPPTSVPQPPIRRIAVISVASPHELKLDRSGTLTWVLTGGIGYLVDRLDLHDKAKKFQARMDQVKSEMGDAMTVAIMKELKAKGFDSFVFSDFQRSAEDPDDIDYAKLHPEADAILHVYFGDVGMYAAAASDYVPRVDVTVKLISTTSQAELYGDYLYYGAEAKKKKKYWAVPSDPKYRYPDFTDLINRPDSVAESLHAGADALGVRIAEELKAKVPN
jgi:hypothetical protein